MSRKHDFSNRWEAFNKVEVSTTWDNWDYTDQLESCFNEWLNESAPKVEKYEKLTDTSLNIKALQQIKLIADDIPTYVKTMQNLVSSKQFQIPSPISGEEVKSSTTFFSNLLNYVRFIDKNANEVFYLVQNYQFLAGLYFPERDYYVQFWGNSLSYVSLLKKQIIKYPNKALERINYAGPKQLKVIVSWNRPWHYFYNIVTAVNILQKDNTLTDVNTLVFPGGQFLDLKKLYGLKSKETSYHECMIEVENTYVSPGIAFMSIPRLEHELLNEYIIKRIKENHTNILNGLGGKDLYPVFWVGITSQKRVWLEQVEGIVKVLEFLNSVFNKLFVVFDGWTNPINATVNDLKQSESDIKLMNKIIDKLSFKLPHTSVIGADSETKIAVAIKADFAIMNYAAGSIHVARFGKTPGVSHLNNIMPRNDQIHYNTTEIEKEFVKDYTENGLGSDEIDYSIDPDIFLNKFKSFLYQLPLGKTSNLRFNNETT